MDGDISKVRDAIRPYVAMLMLVFTATGYRSSGKREHQQVYGTK
jgi:hypothetical protein